MAYAVDVAVNVLRGRKVGSERRGGKGKNLA